MHFILDVRSAGIPFAFNGGQPPDAGIASPHVQTIRNLHILDRFCLLGAYIIKRLSCVLRLCRRLVLPAAGLRLVAATARCACRFPAASTTSRGIGSCGRIRGGRIARIGLRRRRGRIAVVRRVDIRRLFAHRRGGIGPRRLVAAGVPLLSGAFHGSAARFPVGKLLPDFLHPLERFRVVRLLRDLFEKFDKQLDARLVEVRLDVLLQCRHFFRPINAAIRHKLAHGLLEFCAGAFF